MEELEDKEKVVEVGYKEEEFREAGVTIFSTNLDQRHHYQGRQGSAIQPHGILQMPPENKVDQSRISIIAWGWVDQQEA